MSDDECAGCAFYTAGQCKIGISSVGTNIWDLLSFPFGGLSLAPYVPTPCRVIHRMLTLVDLKPRDIIYDLGSGDGRIVMLAAGNFGATAVGFENENDLVKMALDRVHASNIDDKVKIVKDNLLNADIDNADVITMYLSPGGNQKVKPKLERELKAGARVVSLEFEIVGWPLYKVNQIVDRGLTYTIYVYKR